MDVLSTGEMTGIAGVAIGFGILIWRMWQSHTDLSKQVIEVVQKDAEAKIELKNAIENNSRVATETKDALNNVLLELVKTQNIRHDNQSTRH